jgi:hypothetical protein
MTITDKVISIAAGNNRNLNAIVSTTARKAWGVTSTQSSANENRLVDTYVITSDAENEYFDDENRRLPADLINDYDVVPGAITGVWDSTLSLVNGEAQIVNGVLSYPSIDYSVGYLPIQLANYVGFVGGQVYYRAMYDNITPHSSGTYNFGNLTNTDIGPVGAGNINVEIKLPSQTGWLDLGKPYDAGTFTGVDGDGCRTLVVGSSWSWTVSTFSTALSGWMVIVRITLRNGIKTIFRLLEMGW